MSTGTTLPEVKRALVDALSARSGLSDVLVTYEYQQRDASPDRIWFGEDSETEAEIPTMRAGTKTVDETVTVPLVIQVLITDGRDAEAADLRASALMSEVQQQLAESPRIIPGVQWVVLTSWSHHVGPIGDTTSRGSRFDLSLQIRARLTP
ncbi:hypothetical protein SAMN04487905_10624 [Actinopolyspora xinjiangensis]|uniref:Tail terminator n=1 Tax=Actinopolyspora xinjiangensis TaxID=405564 RepID=A0A1H0U364_9ACTN|nr:hypothetical protein [Actinopolyspora xinjiangensis]SDP60742.1 hypothetical protein SAMN04487905_10624 [Actinopolyspora xinjiangensis]